jgi:hypothetical protein
MVGTTGKALPIRKMAKVAKERVETQRAVLKSGTLTTVETVSAKKPAIAACMGPTVAIQAINAGSCRDMQRKCRPNGRHNQSTGCIRRKLR